VIVDLGAVCAWGLANQRDQPEKRKGNSQGLPEQEEVLENWAQEVRACQMRLDPHK